MRMYERIKNRENGEGNTMFLTRKSDAELLLQAANDSGSSTAIDRFVDNMTEQVKIVRKNPKRAGQLSSIVIHFNDGSFLEFWASEMRFKRGFVTAFLTGNIVVGNEEIICGKALET